MRTNKLLIGGLAALLAVLSGCGGSKEPPAPAATSSGTPAEKAIHRRAVEAVIWGIPAVNFDLMLQAAIANGAKPNQIVYWGRPVNWRDQTLTPNPDTIYFNPFFDTREGPVVLEIPPATEDAVVVGTIDAAWQNALTDVGPAGADKGKGGKYLITPPGYAGKTPAGYIVVPTEVYHGFAILRSNFKSRSDADIAAAVEHGKLVKLYPLKAGPGASVAVDMYDKPFEANIQYDWRFFESLHRFVQAEPWLTRDKVMIEQLKTLGIEKGKPFAPDDKMKALFDAAATEAHEYIAASYEANYKPPFFEGTHWAAPVPQETLTGLQTGFADPDVYALDGRGVYFHMAYFSAKQLGTAQFYVLNISDKDGQPFDGRSNYRFTVPANAPELQKNADGSVTLYFGPKAPEGKESNWVPTNNRPFEALFRFYGPDKSLFEKTWALPDIEKTGG